MQTNAAGLVIVMTVLWLSTESVAADPLSQDEFAKKLMSQGVTIQRDETTPERPIVDVRLGGCASRDELVELIAQLPTIERLTLHHGLKDAGFQHVARLGRLTVLRMKGARLTHDAWRHLAGQTGLRELNLADSTLDDAALVSLRGMTDLRDLDLSGTHVTDAGLEELKRFAALESLNLENTHDPITDAGIAHIHGIKSLKRLILGSSDLTDTGLEKLISLQNLKELEIDGTLVTDAGLAAFQRARPDVQIKR